ncbi:hypothetical protein [Cohnella zeiphila]|uniref:Uncharacterized protein n=1 Tax=Cohnella zeiphila TaxID=2761120 RepID=A0A7X0SM84_9BACL|nr:hypothetical protein [Cohnella zeiphila]MBB6731280.1 hypothetical protein [Cohnella zeiphila]
MKQNRIGSILCRLLASHALRLLFPAMRAAWFLSFAGFYPDRRLAAVNASERMKTEELVANYKSVQPGKGEMVFTENASNGILKQKIVF